MDVANLSQANFLEINQTNDKSDEYMTFMHATMIGAWHGEGGDQQGCPSQEGGARLIQVNLATVKSSLQWNVSSYSFGKNICKTIVSRLRYCSPLSHLPVPVVARDNTFAFSFAIF